jgi:hypothetical protein
MTSKDLLSKEIDHLRKDVQYLIDKKKVTSKGDSSKLDNEKKEKLAMLKTATDKLKDLVKLEKIQAQNAKDIYTTARKVDTLEFTGAKQSRSHQAMEKAMEAKVSREEARVQYSAYEGYEKEYTRYDSKDVPGSVFLHDSILTAYGVCPFIRLEVSNEATDKKNLLEAQKVANQRTQWLAKQLDTGKLYYDLRDKVIRETELKELQQCQEDCEQGIENFVKTNLTESQNVVWLECQEFVKEYINCAIKTKRIKDKYKNLIHKLSVLHAETFLDLHEYLGAKFNMTFVINKLASDNSSAITAVIRDWFSNQLEAYTNNKTELEQQTKYIRNTKRNLQEELYLYLTKKKTFVGNFTKANGKNCCFQEGKYFKRWTLLTKEEKNERFASFAEYHVERNMVQQHILEEDKKVEMVTSLSKLLQEAHDAKTIIYRDLKWNTKNGVIEHLKVIKFDQETSKFYITKKEVQKNATPVSKTKRKASSRSIFTKENDKIINEELLLFIVIKTRDGTEKTIEKEDKEKCIEKIKTKLRLKKVTVKDKVLIGKKYDDIFRVVCANESDP